MKKLILFVALVGFIGFCFYLWRSEAPVSPSPTPRPTPEILATSTPPVVLDPRIGALVNFFSKYNCPQISFDLIPDYLHAADQDNLDYRILPAISVQESSCGQHYPQDTNNLWGWDSARTGFPSIREGLSFVAQRLASGFYYQGKTLKQKLHSYNPSPSYAPSIIGLMKEIQQ